MSDKTNMTPSQTRTLEIVAFIALIVVLITPFIYRSRDSFSVKPPVEEEARFVGSEACARCHQATYAEWQGSYHDLAMDVANDDTVLGNFNDQSYLDPHNGVTSRFFRDGQKFMVETEGPDGKPGTFEISYVFGVYPLQQYLVPFPGGRLQCLNIAWDARAKKWFRLPPYEVEGHDDWLHWTKGGMNWNGMCAECHSTRVEKNYAMATDSYETRWFSIDVGCEACHGPGSEHVRWGEYPALARPAKENAALTVVTRDLDNKQLISVCAACHSRRYQLGDNDHSQGEPLDKMIPSLLEAGLYYPDGQIREEVYVYGSFTQSKMYMRGVKCSDCHNVHSLKTHKEGNDLCLQCHRARDYDTPEHHFHKAVVDGKESPGHLCVKCHMPGQVYMGNDYRPDHSIRIPRPDLSAKLGTPNSCSTKECHADKGLSWVNKHYNQWYGETRKPHYGEVFAAARERNDQLDNLIALAGDTLLPEIVRATALSLLSNYPGPESTAVLSRLLDDPEAILRYTAIRNLSFLPVSDKLRLIAPKLYDHVKGVRIEAAVALAAIPLEQLRADDREQFQKALEEYRQAMIYNSDFAPQRYNLGNLAAAQGNSKEAINFYDEALQIDSRFFPVKINMAMVYNRIGDKDEAERLLRDVLDEQPRQYSVAYSLGLLLAEKQDYAGAARYLGMAADGMPDYTRARYNQALAYLKLKQWQEGSLALLKALERDPTNQQYFVTLANLYLNLGEYDQARQLALETLARVPDHQTAQQLLQQLGN